VAWVTSKAGEPSLSMATSTPGGTRLGGYSAHRLRPVGCADVVVVVLEVGEKEGAGGEGSRNPDKAVLGLKQPSSFMPCCH
jgi:hypothetical protein